MKSILALLVLSVVAPFALTAESDTWKESLLLEEGLRHSDIALMPEGTPGDYALFAPLRPTVVAWGEDALPMLDGGDEARARFAQKSEAYRQLGVRLQAANVWMLTATQRYMHRHPELLDATCVDLWGEKILPRWLADAEFEGVKPWWGCTNNPLFQEHLLARMRAGLEAGATMVHLDDHSGTFACAQFAGGCFCGHCMRGFREWMGHPVDTRELEEAGVADSATYDYRAFLLERGFADRAAFVTAAANDHVPLWDRFLEFQRKAAIGFVQRMQVEAERIAGRPVPFGVNSYNLLPVQLFDAHAIDYFANEVEQFGVEDLVSPVVYRLGEALGRPVFATGTGEDWIKYRQAKSVTRVRGWIAQAYAFGQFFMYSWNKWGFSDETGTLWTRIDPEVFQPMVGFVSDNAELFDGFENAAAIGLTYQNAPTAEGDWDVREQSKTLLDAGVSYGLSVAGDVFLRKRLSDADFDPYRVVIVPGDTDFADEVNRFSSMSGWNRSGGRFIAFPGNDEGLRTLPGRIDVQCDGRVWALPRVHRDGPRMVVHLLNRDYDAANDAMVAKTGLKVSIVPATLGGPATVRSVRYYTPAADPRDLRFQQAADGTLRFEAPDLDIWGIAAIE